MEPEIRVIEDSQLARVFMSKTRGNIIKELASKPGSISQLARTLGISPPAVYYHIKILEEASIIKATRIEKVNNNLVEKFYELASPGFMVLGDGPLKNGPVPRRKHSDDMHMILNFDGLSEFLGELGLTIKDGYDDVLKDKTLALLKILATHAQIVGKGVLKQLDSDLSRYELQKMEMIIKALIPLSVIYAFDDPEFIEALRSLKTVVEPI